MQADAILITKTDLATAEQVTATHQNLAGLALTSRVLTGEGTGGASALIAQRFDPTRLDKQGISRWVAEEVPAVHAEGVSSFAINDAVALTEAQITVFSEAMRVLHGPRLLRMKAMIASVETPDQPIILHQVQSAIYPPVRLSSWPGPDRRSKLVFITEGIAEANIRAFWEALLKA